MAVDVRNPLRSLHEQLQAEFQSYGDIDIVATFGEPQAEYAAVRKGCAMFDEPHRGILELTGKDRLPFLNNLLTNQTWSKETKSGLTAGQGVYAFFLNLKGRIVADMNVLELGERTLLEMDARMVEPVRGAFEKYLFGEQVKISSRSGSLHQIALHGPTTRDVLNQVLDAPLPELPELGSLIGRILGFEVILWRDDPAGVPGYHVLVPSESAATVWAGLLERFSLSDRLGKRALRAAGWAVFNAARIEGGRALFGIDFDESVLPAETGKVFGRAVSLTKGCYLGQEIVARMHARGQVARQLVGIRMEGDELPIAGNKIFDESSNEVGGITSSTVSPVLSNAAICLGYVKRPLFTAGTVLSIAAEGAMRKGRVVELPFLGG